jgi:hypothetical protein
MEGRLLIGETNWLKISSAVISSQAREALTAIPSGMMN